jgi:hypothetical protein
VGALLSALRARFRQQLQSMLHAPLDDAQASPVVSGKGFRCMRLMSNSSASFSRVVTGRGLQRDVEPRLRYCTFFSSNHVNAGK